MILDIYSYVLYVKHILTELENQSYDSIFTPPSIEISMIANKKAIKHVWLQSL